MMTATAVASTARVQYRHHLEPLAFLRIYVAVLFIIPARLIVPGTGAVGTPAAILAVVAAGWWCAATLLQQREFAGRNPVRTVLLAYLAFLLLSWTLGRTRPLTALEASTSDRALIGTVGLVGIALVTMDGLRSRGAVARLVRWIVGCSMVMVVVGLVQFLFGHDLSTAFNLPGLVSNIDAEDVFERSLFFRPHGTALHPIEFGVVSAALVPLAFWVAKRDGRMRAYVPMALSAFAAMTSLSRSAVLAAGIAGIVLLFAIPWRQRATILLCGGIFVVAAGVVIDGLVGTLRSLFTSADTDPSVQTRIGRLPRVYELVAENPWLGRGYGTFTPEDYFLLDNELHKTAIESGLIGVAVLVVVIGFIAQLAWRTRVGSEKDRLGGAALMATILGLFISSYTFDAFFYRILTGVLYLCIGMVGALYRLTGEERRVEEAALVALARERSQLRTRAPAG